MNDECSKEYRNAITYVDNQSATQNMRQIKKEKKNKYLSIPQKQYNTSGYAMWFTATPKPLKKFFGGHPAPKGCTAPIF